MSDIDAALEVIEREYNSHYELQLAALTLAAAYRELQKQYEEVDAALTAVCEERDQYHDDLEKAQKQYAEAEAALIEARAKAGRYLTKLVRCNNAIMDRAQRGDALAEAVETVLSYPNNAAIDRLSIELDKYRGDSRT